MRNGTELEPIAVEGLKWLARIIARQIAEKRLNDFASLPPDSQGHKVLQRNILHPRGDVFIDESR
ncbi:hypothetical protein KAR91_11275 [Candidatus Pacearchaeota archaeon]|nr:hypothetical protein [Candidatus Pacearchaeota archaeon]